MYLYSDDGSIVEYYILKPNIIFTRHLFESS